MGLVLSFFAFLFLLFSMGIYLHEPGVPARGVNCVIASLPFLFCVGMVYLCFAGETSWGRALLYTVGSEVLGLLLGSLLLVAFSYLKREPRILLEQRVPFTEARERGGVPELPLSSEAVGVELPDGRFYPIMFLKGRLPEHGYKTPLLTVDVKAGHPRIRVYRGTNEIAAANHFLGEYEISGYSKAKQSLQMMIIFDIETDGRLFLQARDVDAAHNIALKSKPVKENKSQ